MSGLLTFVNRRVIERRAPGALIVRRIAHVLKILNMLHISVTCLPLLKIQQPWEY